MTDSQPMDPADAFGRLGRIKLGDTDLDGVLDQIAQLAKRTIPGADEVSVTLVTATGGAHRRVHRRPGPDPGRVAVRDGPRALPRRVRRARPPCPCRTWPARTAGRTGPPGRCRPACTAPCRSDCPSTSSVTGALNIYATKPDAFDDDAIILAQTFAGYAAVALANVHLYDATGHAGRSRCRRRWRAAPSSSRPRASSWATAGAPPTRRSPSSAKLSQDTNRKLRDVAAALVDRAKQPPRSGT